MKATFEYVLTFSSLDIYSSLFKLVVLHIDSLRKFKSRRNFCVFTVSWAPEERHLIRLAQAARREQHHSARAVTCASICFAKEVEGASLWKEDLEPFPSPSEFLRKHLEPRPSDR